MKLNDILKAAGKNKKAKRVGRGRSSGMGKTSTRGHKGYHSRAGSGAQAGFEGGQNPQIRRVPKRGFNNYNFAKAVQIVNLSDLQKAFADGDEVTAETLAAKKLIEGDAAVKLLGNGELTVKLTVKLPMASKTAAEKVAAAGGTFEAV